MKTCKTCKWFTKPRDKGWPGSCNVPTPDSVDGALAYRAGMFPSEGKTCRCHQPKKKGVRK